MIMTGHFYSCFLQGKVEIITTREIYLGRSDYWAKWQVILLEPRYRRHLAQPQTVDLKRCFHSVALSGFPKATYSWTIHWRVRSRSRPFETGTVSFLASIPR